MSGLDDFATDDAQDDDNLPTAKPSALEAGASVTVTATTPVDQVDTDYGPAMRFEAEYRSDSEGSDFDGEGPFGAGDAVEVFSWSKRLGRAMLQAVDRHDLDGVAGETVTIYALGEQGSTSRTYDVELVDDDADD